MSNERDLEKIGQSAFESIQEMVEALDTEDETELEQAQQTIQEDPLSVLVRSQWYTPGSVPEPPAEYEILLSWGGPATRIVGDLNEYSEPSTARLEVQDWFLPWTEYVCNEDVLLEYAWQFYFGD